MVVNLYPKADTPGCTVQACGVRGRRDDYDAVIQQVLRNVKPAERDDLVLGALGAA